MSAEKGPAPLDSELTRMPSIPDVDDKEESHKKEEVEVKEEDEPHPKSPLLTERRISTASLDNVDLEDDDDDEESSSILSKGTVIFIPKKTRCKC